MHLVSHPWGGNGQRTGDHLVKLLVRSSPRFKVFRACVAFVKASGVLRLAPSFKTFMDKGGLIEIVVGIDEQVTTKQGLELVMKYSTKSYVFHNPASTFHPKFYAFEIPGRRATVLVGSSNFTVGGLYTNYESNLMIDLDLTESDDRKEYQKILDVFGYVSDIAGGNAKQLSQSVIDDLASAGFVVDEGKRTPKRSPTGDKTKDGISSVFPRIPVLPPPSIDPSVAMHIPAIQHTGDKETDIEAEKQFQTWKTFVMTLGARDTKQKAGYSPDIFVPLIARDFDKEFWGWDDKFSAGAGATVGKYMERRFDILVRPVSGSAQIVEGVRLYYYDIKHEFRLNCGRLIQGAKADDLLLIQKSPMGTMFKGHIYEYEATVFPKGSPEYSAFVKACNRKVKGSPRRWGYL